MPLLRLIAAVLLLCIGRCAVGAEMLYVAPEVYNGVAVTQHDKARAEKTFNEGQAAAQQGAPSLALRRATEALHSDPHHAGARQVLGYVFSDGQWQTPYQADRAKRGLLWDDRFGWTQLADLPRLKAGERPLGKRWISAEVDTARHSEIADGWQVRTDHFLVTTNHSPQTGVALAAELEDLFQVWRQLFAGYYLTDREITQRFAGERRARKNRPFRIVYHRNKAGYVKHLERRQPRIAQTLGIYFPVLREAHFYHSDDPTEAARLRPTLYHEAVHQLFRESLAGSKKIATDANYWVIEGVACYFETLTPLDGGRYTIGRGGRLRSAAAQPSPLPLAELTALGQSDLQRRPDLAALYAQSTALVAMLMVGDREALVRYLKAVYSRRPGSNELAKQVGRSYAELDAEYQTFIKNQ